MTRMKFMSKGTRSRTLIPGRIQDYIMTNPRPSNLDEAAIVANEEEVADDIQEMTRMMTEMAKNPNQMNVMMMQNMMMMTKVMTQNQKMMEKFFRNTQRINSDRKIQNCPIRKKSSSLEAWIREVELWNDTFEGDDLAKLKYLNFMKNVRKSECDDLKKWLLFLVKVVYKD